MSPLLYKAIVVAARVSIVACAIASAVLGVYGGMLVYAAATFDSDGPPGSMVLYMAAFAVLLAALLLGGMAHVAWNANKRYTRYNR